MKLKQLEGLLGGLQQFPQPKVELEQYPTGPHIASRMLYTIVLFYSHLLIELPRYVTLFLFIRFFLSLPEYASFFFC